MRKELVASLVVGVIALGVTTAAQATLVEVVPVEYEFDRATGVGTYDYSDWGGIQLTDGMYGVDDWTANNGLGNAHEWVGWKNASPVNIDFDFGGAITINQIDIGTVQDHPDDVVLPSAILYSSGDGSTWTAFASIDVPEDTANNNTRFTYEFSGISITEQYFRISLLHSSDGPWTFTDEIDFYHETNPVPEPATMMLFGTGLAGLVGFGRRKKK